MNEDYDFFDTPIVPYTILVDGAEVVLHVRSTATMEQMSVRGIVSRDAGPPADASTHRLHVYGRLGEHISSGWHLQVLEELDESALATDHELARSMDMEQSLQSAEKFKESRFRRKQ